MYDYGFDYEEYEDVYDDEYGEEWIVYDATASTFPGGGYPSMLALPPAIAVLLAVFMLGAFFNFAFDQMPDIEIEVVAPASEEAVVQATTRAEIAPLFTPQVRRWTPQILAWAQTWGLDPNLIATVMQIESCGDPQAQSPAGARGLFQVMPFHFAEGEDMFDPDTNARRGLSYLLEALEAQNGDVRLGLAGYNAGINAAKKSEANWPAETKRYVYYGVGIYRDASKGLSQSPTLDEWLSKGGANLCQQAAEH